MQPGRLRKEDVPYQERREELRKILRSRRDLLKFSRKELSARSGVSASTIQAIEDGRVVDPGLFTVISLGVALRIDLGPMMSSLTRPIDPQLINEPGETAPAADDASSAVL
jgi:transcriptional regulator with XRE-family HTH domain